jgi:hypothetical protein
MATIPQIVTSPGAVPGTPSAPSGGGLVRASPQMDVRAPSDPSQAQAAGANIEAQALESTARSADKVAQYGEQFADQYVKAKLNIDAANRTADLSAQLHEAEFQSSKIADRDAATADFDGRAAKIRDDFAAQDVNPRVRAAVDASLPNQIALRRASTQQAAFGLWSQAQVGSLITNIDQYGKQAIDAQDPRLTEQLIAQANAAIDGRVEGGALKADVAAKMKVDFGSNVYRTKIEIAMAKDMRTGIALFEATKGKLNAQDLKIMTNVATDRGKQVDADDSVSANMPTMGGGTGGDVGGVKADAEKTLGFPLTITSADRSEAHNKEVGGATGSQHLSPGKALDISLAGLSEEQRQKVYNQFLSDPRVGGIGFYEGHLHVDTRGGRRVTWGKPPAAIAELVGVWSSTASSTPAPSGDQHAQTRVAQAQYIESIATDPKLDPEVKARRISIANQRMGIENTIVMEQRKSAADAAEKAGIDLNTGQYKVGTYQGIADQFTATGDTSSAAAMQVLADNEAQLIEDARNPPAQRSAASMLLPGAAGKIAAQKSAETRADLTEARQLAAQNRTENNRLGTEQEKIVLDSINADVNPQVLAKNVGEAYRYFVAAGNMAKANAMLQLLEGAKEGSTLAKLPPAEREKKKQEMQEILTSNARDGIPLTVAEATVAKYLTRNEEANRQNWEKDPLTATAGTGRIQLQSFDTNMDNQNLQMWATKRLADLRVAAGTRDGTVTNLPNNFFTQDEMSSITQRLEGMKPQEKQQFLARLAASVPAEAIPLIGNQMSKKDLVSDSMAAALGLYGRRQPGDIDIANRVITGMTWLTQGGQDGKTRIGDDKLLQSTIDTRLIQARVGMRPETVALQNNAIMANYVALTAGNPNRTSIDTDKLDQAITEIVGKTMTHNGASTLIPREIEPYQFKNGVAAINAADVANLRPDGQGQPIRAEVVRQKGVWVPAGDGKYQVHIPDPLAAGRLAPLIDNNTGRPWVVEIKPLIARGVTNQGAPDQQQPALYRRNLPQPAPDVPTGPTP